MDENLDDIFKNIADDIKKQVDLIHGLNEEFTKKRNEAYKNKSAISLRTKYTPFNNDIIKSRISLNIQIMYAAAFFNLLFKNDINVFKFKYISEHKPELFEVNAEIIINDKTVILKNQFEMMYWEFFNIPENKNIKCNNIPIIENNQILFTLMDYIRRTR